MTRTRSGKQMMRIESDQPVSRRGFLQAAAGPLMIAAYPELVFAAQPQMPIRGLCAHRGAGGTHPENTLPAFEEAIRLGVHMIEFDVRLTRDLALVLMHDATVDRTTNGHGAVADLTLAELRRLDAGISKHAKFAGTRIPTLEEALAIMPRNVWLNCDLKGGADLGAAVARAVMKAGRRHQAFLAARAEAAKVARAIEPSILICNMERLPKLRDYVDETIAMQAIFIQLLEEHGVPRDDIALLKRRHVRVNYCCADSAEAVRTLLQAGVDFPLVDDPGRFMPVARELGIQPLQPRF